jgi:hypothetical protein
MPAVTTTPCSDGANGHDDGTVGSQKELVQQWVNSILTHNGVETGETTTVACHGAVEVPGDTKIVMEMAEDDLSLGAEARLLQSEQVHTVNAAVAEDTPRQEQLNYGTVLRQRFGERREQSFNSDSSRHSLEQLLNEHRLDPVRILTNLGFVGHSKTESHHIPEHFLVRPSRANGISVDDYLSRNPKLRRQLDRKLALQNAFQAVTAATAATGAPSSDQDAGAQGERAATMQAFSKVAQTVTLINRFRSRTLNRQASILAEPILHTSSIGNQYWSILEDDNCRFLERIGYYDGTGPATSKNLNKSMATKKSWAVAKSAAMSKLTIPASCSTAVSSLDVPTIPSLVAGSTAASLTGRGQDPIERSSPCRRSSPSAGPPVALAVEPTAVGSAPCYGAVHTPISPLNIPSRFFSCPSACPTTTQPLLRPLFPPSNITTTSQSAVSEAAGSVDDATTSSCVIIPTIEINNNESQMCSRDRRLLDHSGFEWYQSCSLSSSSVDDVLSPSSDDSYIDRLQAIRSLRGNSSTDDDIDQRLGQLAVPSDAASTISSHTLVEQDTLTVENPGISFDGSTYTVVQSVDNDDDLGNLHERQTVNHALREVNSFDIEEVDSNADTWADNLPPFNLPTKIRCVLRRQGSSQSDSSGFVDTDQVDAPATDNSTSPSNKIHTRHPVKHLQLKSRSFTTIEATDDLAASGIDSATEQNPTAAEPKAMPVGNGNSRLDQAGWLQDEATQTEWTEAVSSYLSQGMSLPQQKGESGELSGTSAITTTTDSQKSSSHIYTTRLYIDTVIPTVCVPQLDKTEVMLIVGKSHENQTISQPLLPLVKSVSSMPSTVEQSLHQRRFLTSVDIQASSSSVAGQQTLTPTTSRSVEIITGQQKDSTVAVMRGGTFGGPLRRKFDEFNMMQQRRKTLERDRRPFDVTDHQILHSLIHRSVFVSPQTLAYLCPPAEWSSTHSTHLPVASNMNQCLIEEVKLVQQALAKYRLEMKALTMRTRIMYANVQPHLCGTDRQELADLSSLQVDLVQEVDALDTLLSQRMKLVIGGQRMELDPTSDLGTLGVVHEMNELLKEQLYHSNIVTGMGTRIPCTECHLHDSVATSQTQSDDSLDDVTDVATTSSPLPLQMTQHFSLRRGTMPSRYQDVFSPSLATALLDRLTSLEQRITDQQQRSASAGTLLEQFEAIMAEKMKNAS